MSKSLEQSFLTATDRDQISKPLQFVRWYQTDIATRGDETRTIVEVGVYRGHFLRALESWLPKVRLIGIDLQDFRTVTLQRASFHLADQNDLSAIDSVLSHAAPEGVDIIIDDASHLGRSSLALFNATFNRWLRPGGYYYIEDWGTGYWKDWPDGAEFEDLRIEGERFISHDTGMVGFVKSLIDEVAASDRRPPGVPRIQSMLVRPGLVRLEKTR